MKEVQIVMESLEMTPVYDDSHTLDRPTPTERTSVEYYPLTEDGEKFNPLDQKRVRDLGHEQGWGN